MKKAILVAHGSSIPSSSIPKVTTITRAGQVLTFDKAIEYIKSKKSWPEYASTSFDHFGQLNDRDCIDLFGVIPVGSSIVPTGLRRDDGGAGVPIYTLRGVNCTRAGIIDFIERNNFTSLVLLACRSV